MSTDRFTDSDVIIIKKKPKKVGKDNGRNGKKV